MNTFTRQDENVPATIPHDSDEGGMAGEVSKRNEEGSSAPATRDNLRHGEGGSQAGETGCTCGFCDGVTVEVESVNLHSGAVEVESFDRMSRRPRCPNCGGVNVQYRRSYTAHVADVVDRVAGERNVYALHVTLDSEAVQRAGLTPEQTYQVWTDGGPWTRARRNLRNRDEDLMWMGTLPARPSDGMYHLHLVIITRLSVPNLREALHAPGLDSYVQSFDRSETADSKEQFAAMWAAYAFDNAAYGPSARFTASRQRGEGYDSAAAKERRRAAVGERSGHSGSPARGPRRNDPQGTASGGEESGAVGGSNGPTEGESSGEADERAPPVGLGGGGDRDRAVYLSAVKRRFVRRVGSAVHVVGVGPAELLKVATKDEGIVCTVVPEIGTEAITTSWTEIRVANAPRLRRRRRPSRGRQADTEAPGPEQSSSSDPVARFTEAARMSRFQYELGDGRRYVTEVDHLTGEASEYVLPPRTR